MTLRFIKSVPCKGMKRHKWCNHPEHRHCVVCGIFRED